jgi:hypothetical protein
MPENSRPQRRDFLKTAAASAAGVMGLGALKFDSVFAQSTGGWTTGMQVNPAIDNKRVICCHDTKMLTANPQNNNWANQNSTVDAAVVTTNLDQMAMQLAQKTTAADAWSAIFRSGKDWASTKVAIKVNGIGGATGNHPRVAVVKKICDVFVDQFKVPAANIVLYDANTDAGTCYSSFTSLTDSTKIRAVVSSRAGSLNGFKPVTIVNVGSGKTISCVADLVDGVIDILVDICVLKVHDGPGGSYGYGSCTLCMKNHLGTFMNSDSTTGNIGDATGLHSIPAICEINKHPAILGGNPVRQQLCIVDGLLANGKSPAGSWDTRVDRIVMGTFAPIVDYLTAKNVLFNTAVMTVAAKATTGAAAIPQFLTTFDYAETDALEWVEYIPGSGTVTPTGGSGGNSGAGGAAGSGGTSGAGGARGGSGGAGGAGSGATSGAGGAPSGGTSGAGGAAGGGSSGGAGSGGATSAGSTTDNGGTTSVGGGSGGTGGLAASATPATGGSTTTGGTTAGSGTASSSAGGSDGTTEATSGKAAAGSSGSGCNVAGVDRRATPWGAMLAFGAVVAGKLRRLVSGSDQ